MPDLHLVPEEEPEAEPRPASLALRYYATELKRHREAAGLTQAQLAELIPYSKSMVSMVETAKRSPVESREGDKVTSRFTECCDEALNTGGALSRILPLLESANDVYKSWFRPYTVLEAEATMITGFASQTVPGLLQTEDYARELLRSYYPPMSDEEVERQVQGRMRRQEILLSRTPPLLWFVLDEAVIQRPVGSDVVFRAQLERLVEAGQGRRTKIQVMPFERRAHAGLSGMMVILQLPEERAVYVEAPGTAHITTVDQEVIERTLSFNALCERALSVDESVRMISSMLGEP
ncbi:MULTISPECIES: helix-turn-helix domain-containing protein [Nocardiopsidaceae]|uniref:Helix-turn-helix transcriptional regulator n=1 Tax=Streptomonospora nanhaiensis TaxID=1323731 RepID=A0ABY6YI84_9ACTN|nr:helix-turn-helix transcriptional regulator [Streptomonospora nanhaiensis]WAE71993.1 helix-turn-helix transcriptional regulator [Streptomonospora nanhaiensis]